ncbi:MAG: cupin domain-containing protein [Flavobacteriaceae bacterium]
MKVTPPATTPTRQGNADWFSGTVWQDPLNDAPEPARVSIARVTFEPGARTAWHTHPYGQTLHVLSGVGLVQSWGGTPHVIRAGDTVWIEPGDKHWHGAAPGHLMVHLAIQEKKEGRAADWMEKVSDSDYRTAARAVPGQ